MDEQFQSVDSQDTELKHGHSIYCGRVLVRHIRCAVCKPVSYTHLDVYKRQKYTCSKF